MREVRTHLRFDLLGQAGALVGHGEEHSRHAQAGIHARTDALDRIPELAQALESVVLGLNGDQNLVGSHHDIQRHEAERGRAINEDNVNLMMRRHVPAKRSLQATLTPGHVNQFNLGTRQVDCRRAHEDALDIGTRLDNILQLRSPDHHVIRRWCAHGVRDAKRAGCVALRVRVDNKHRQTTHCKASSQVDGRGRLTDAALLVGDCNDARGRRLAILSVCEHTQIGDVAFNLRGQRGVFCCHVTPS